MKNAAQFYNGIEIVILTATFKGNTANAKADLYQEPNKSFYTAVAAGTCAPVESDKVATIIINPA